MQCDIDILGDDSLNAEVELIDVTARALMAIGFSGFTVNVNDRRLLRGMLQGLGFEKEALDSVCISFDKLDKIGLPVWRPSCGRKGLRKRPWRLWKTSLQRGPSGWMKWPPCARIRPFRKCALCAANGTRCGQRAYAVEYNPSLVRGQGYYTGMVFEVTCAEFSGGRGRRRPL